MHISHRLLAIAISVMILVPLAVVSALSSVDGERYKVTEAIRKASDVVFQSSKIQREADSTVKKSKTVIQTSEQKLQKLARDKRAVRLQLAQALKDEKDLLKRGIDLTDADAVLGILEREKDRMGLFLRSLHIAYASQTTGAIGALLGQILVSETLGERTEEAIRMRAVLQAREDLLTIIRRAEGLPDAIEEMREEHKELLAEYSAVQKQFNVASQNLHESASDKDKMKSMVNEMQYQVNKMQSELARIDARIRRRAERALIEKGLRSPKIGEYSGGKIVGGAATLTWPVIGRISAGFYEASYRKYFGFPHKGIDIVVPQGSSVYAAADGIVYLSRPSGGTGYSYVIIGHKGGTATLYGHLSQITVSTGQDVYRGQTIGKSGGRPGTAGAGYQTTGSHLHFEVTQMGKHVNPVGVLP